MRQVVNAIFYVVRTGCQWENLPKEYPNHNSVYYHYRKWCKDGTWRRVNTALRKLVDYAEATAQFCHAFCAASLESERLLPEYHEGATRWRPLPKGKHPAQCRVFLQLRMLARLWGPHTDALSDPPKVTPSCDDERVAAKDFTPEHVMHGRATY
jgi:transposase